MALASADRYDARPAHPTGTAVLLLAGSSGRIESARAELLAEYGARVRAMRWFGGSGQRAVPHEVPLEGFLEQLDDLRADADRVAILGTSFGAEAALAVATLTSVDVTVAIAPSAVVWGGVLERVWSSHWTYDGRPLPYVPFADGWRPATDPPEYLGLYEASLDVAPEAVERARIPVERIGGGLVLVCGGDDRVWPSVRFARMIEARRAAAGRATDIVSEPGAGHRLLLPGEQPATSGQRMARGGTPEADRRLGERAWAVMRNRLGLR